MVHSVRKRRIQSDRSHHQRKRGLRTLKRRSGPPTKEEVSLGFRELETSPHARILYNARLGELIYFPFITAYTYEDKVFYTACIDEAFGLSIAMEEGLIADWSIRWNSRFYPMKPRRIKLLPPRRQRTGALGRGWEDYVSRYFLKELRRLFPESK